MSGALCAAAAGSGTAAPPPFNGSVSLQGGSSFTVSGATGDIYTQGGAVISVGGSGGTGGYTFSVSAVKDAGDGSVSKVAASDGIHDTVGYNLPNVGDTILFHLSWSAHDSGTPQQNDSGRDPSNVSQSYVITRGS